MLIRDPNTGAIHEFDIATIALGSVEPTQALIEMMEAGRPIANTTIGDVWISTVFTGFDYSFLQRGARVGPRCTLSFETMLRKRGAYAEQFRWRTEAIARAMHAHIVELVTADPECELTYDILRGDP